MKYALIAGLAGWCLLTRGDTVLDAKRTILGAPGQALILNQAADAIVGYLKLEKPQRI